MINGAYSFFEDDETPIKPVSEFRDYTVVYNTFIQGHGTFTNISYVSCHPDNLSKLLAERFEPMTVTTVQFVLPGKQEPLSY